MTTINRLINAYKRHIRIPWRENLAPDQRVICLTYPECRDCEVAAGLMAFENATREAGHGWALFDLQGSFEHWLTHMPYAEMYFEKPLLLPIPPTKYLQFIVESFKAFLQQTAETGEKWRDSDHANPADRVVSLRGVDYLFGILDVWDVVKELAPLVQGRLLIFFPGVYENFNYKLLSGCDGPNYRAVPITGDDAENELPEHRNR